MKMIAVIETPCGIHIDAVTSPDLFRRELSKLEGSAQLLLAHALPSNFSTRQITAELKQRYENRFSEIGSEKLVNRIWLYLLMHTLVRPKLLRYTAKAGRLWKAPFKAVLKRIR
jgi:hypothetical protein